jgi:Flp pilus assembly protein TadG
MRGLFRRFIGHRRAVAAVEFAIIAPMMLVLAGGIVEIGSLARAYAAVNRLTMQYALSLADCADTASGVCQTEMNNDASTTTLANIVPQLNVSNLTLQMAQVQMSGTTPTIQYSYPSGLTLTAAQISALRAAVTSGTYGVVVTASYTYTLLFFSKLMSPIIGSSFPISFSVAQLKN